jgi:hypothetical protein
MSISKMVGLSVAHERDRSIVKATAAGAAPPVGTPPKKEQGKVGAALDKITAFVPSEALGAYTVGLGVFSPTTYPAKWWIFGICLALIPILMVFTYLSQQKTGNTGKPPFTSWLVLVSFALIAFVAWAASLPNTPFLEFTPEGVTPQATTVAGWAVVILAGIMYKVAALLNVVPPNPSAPT